MLEKVGFTVIIETKRRTLAKIQRQWNKTVPAVVVGAMAEFTTWQDQIQGVIPTLHCILLFGDAWMGDAGP